MENVIMKRIRIIKRIINICNIARLKNLTYKYLDVLSVQVKILAFCYIYIIYFYTTGEPQARTARVGRFQRDLYRLRWYYDTGDGSPIPTHRQPCV